MQLQLDVQTLGFAVVLVAHSAATIWWTSAKNSALNEVARRVKLLEDLCLKLDDRMTALERYVDRLDERSKRRARQNGAED
jgi:predicted transcriptional regulator